jgi:hypothetical protein
VSPRPQKEAHITGVPPSSRTSPCGRADATARLRTAQAYLDVAELVLGERDRDEYLNVAAGLAVLAGIAASDAICCVRLGCRHRGDDHRSAADVLRQATPDGAELAVTLLRLLDLKDAAHYGVMIVAARKGRDALRWAGRLVDRAREETER